MDWVSPQRDRGQVMSFFLKRIKKFGEVKTTLKSPNLGPKFNSLIFVKFGKIEAHFVKRKREIFLPIGFRLTVMKY